MSICQYCGKPIEDEPVMNPDENGNGYHHYCLVDMEFKTRDKQIYDKGKADAFRWIPVSERLPEKTGLYLISIDDLVTTGSFDGHNFRTRTMVEFIPDAWMPLPKPYKGD